VPQTRNVRSIMPDAVSSSDLKIYGRSLNNSNGFFGPLISPERPFIALRMGAPFLVERGIAASEEGLGPALVMRRVGRPHARRR
jgi:hypothetical protein